MAVEARRGCGYRKVGGIYLVSGKLMAPCGGLPFPLHVCPTCGEGIKQTRGWTWINAKALFQPINECREPYCSSCPVSHPPEKAGLIWIGGSFYKTPGEFMREAIGMGVSRRISTVPRGLEVGKTQIYVAHPKAIISADLATPPGAGVITAFVPTAIEIIITQSQSQDEEFMAGLEKRKLTPVIVPDDDPDHQGSVYDKAEDDESPVLDLGAR